jgi:hypothetical protein
MLAISFKIKPYYEQPTDFFIASLVGVRYNRLVNLGTF